MHVCVCRLPLFLLITQAVFRLHIDPVLYPLRPRHLHWITVYTADTQDALREEKKILPIKTLLSAAVPLNLEVEACFCRLNFVKSVDLV